MPTGRRPDQTIDRSTTPIVAIAPTPWRGTWMNRQHLLTRLGAKGWPIVYSTGPASVWQRTKDSWAQLPPFSRVEEVDEIRLVTGGRYVAAWPRSALATRLANRIHADVLRRTAGRYWNNNGILFLFHPSFQPLVEIMRPRYVAFHVFDAYAEMEAWDTEQDRRLDRLCRRADLLTAASDAMGEGLPACGRGKVKILPNGVDISHFAEIDAAPCPADLAAIPRPRIANVGTLNLKIDFGILAAMAHDRPDWSLVFIGPVNEANIATDPDADRAYRALRAAPNTYFLGPKHRSEVPAYMAQMDVNLVCYLIRHGHWASKGYPLKLNEYLAAGKPVVATPTDAIQRHFGSVVEIAANSTEFIRATEQALQTGGRSTSAERQAVARSNTWDVRVDRLDEWLQTLTARPAGVMTGSSAGS